MTTLVLGYGEMGRAMECLLKDRVPLAIWEKFPQGGFRSVSLREAARQAEMAIFCLPTAAHTAVLADLVPQLATGCTCLTVAKGLDAAGRPVAEILRAALGERFPYGTLHGPMIAEEILAGRGAFAQLGYRG
ncbi:MAG: hypothetical protein L6Q83_04795, partial [Gammaproteobacteria bacterium]|nr:hypothetical protein [Gammaproteobacteria bacterium]